VVDLIQSVSARQKNTRENPLVATLHLVDSNHRRYGSHIVHAGIVMIVAGIAGSSLYNTKSTVQVGPGQSVSVGKYTLTLDSIQEVRGSNYTAVAAKVSFVRDDGPTHILEPQRRFYDKAEEASSEVAIRSNWKEDLYVTLAGWEQGGRVTTLQVIVNPLVRWIWAGGVVLCLGAIFCLLPRIAGKEQTAPAPVRSSPGRRPRARVAVAH
jgi:cytochrome c-type biogenesis protein CcmF